MMYCFRQIPFFLASIGIHIVVFALFSLRLDMDMVEKFIRDQSIIEVKLMDKAKTEEASRSIVEYKNNEHTQKELIYFKSENRDNVIGEFYKSDYRINIHLMNKRSIPEKNIKESANRIKEKGINNDKTATLTTHILYLEKGRPDINIDHTQKNTGNVMQQDYRDNWIKQDPGIEYQYSDNKNKDILADSKTVLKQDYEMVRRLIEEKANKFVPIVYKRKLLEKKKRIALVQMIINHSGYVNNHILLKSTGLVEMDRSIHAILHLAEPYVFFPRPVDIEIVFYE